LRRSARTTPPAVPDLVGRLLTDASDERVPPAGWAPAELASRVPAIRRVVGQDDAGDLSYVASRLTGRVRLLTGMVKANRPGRALLGLSKLLVAAFGTAAFALTTNTIWHMGDALGGLRLAVIMLLGLTALVAWLIVAHDLWEKPDEETSAELARMFNLGTILTLTLATAVRLDHQLAGHRRRRDRIRAGGRGNGASRRVRLPSRTRRLAGREGRVVPPRAGRGTCPESRPDRRRRPQGGGAAPASLPRPVARAVRGQHRHRGGPSARSGRRATRGWRAATQGAA